MTKYRIAYVKIQTTTTLDGVETLHDPSWYAILFAGDKRIDGYNGMVAKDQEKALHNLAHLIVTVASLDDINHVQLSDLPIEIQPFIQERLNTLHPTVRERILGREKTQ